MAGKTFTPDARARVRIDAVWVTEHAADVVHRAYRAGGGTSPYDHCPLQRRLRDIQTLSQHFLIRRDVTAAGGSVLAGREPPGPVF